MVELVELIFLNFNSTYMKMKFVILEKREINSHYLMKLLSKLLDLAFLF